MRRRSRLSSSQEKKNKKTIIFSIIGILIIVIIMYKFGVEALINFSLFLGGGKDSQATTNTKQIDYVSPPIINSLPSATNSASIIITGSAKKGQTIELYINRTKKATMTKIDKDGFEFTQDLKKGENLIQVKAKEEDKESDFSNFYTVNFQNEPPKLELSSPADGDSFHREDKSANVRGQTDAGVTVTVNGFFAVIDESNNFSYTLPLHDGDNDIQIIAQDQAGNKTEKKIRVNYSQ